jgi:hypothetical protein
LYGSALGYFAERDPEVGFACGSEQLGSGSIRRITPFADGFLLGEDKPPSRDNTSATILRKM